jgi:hypothetical protein
MNLNKIFFGIICAFALLLSSCMDFLKEEPRSSLRSEDYFSSFTLSQAAVNSLYRYGPNNWSNTGSFAGSHLMLGGWSSGLFDNPVYKGQETFVRDAQEFTMNESNMDNKFRTMFVEPFIAINRANLIINTLPDIDLIATRMTEVQRDRLIAEARFFRAQHYFWLVRHWGDVPLMLTNLNAADDLTAPRVSTKRIYDEVIIPDLLAAVETLEVESQYGYGMRITAPIASAYLIDAYVQMAGYPLQDASKWALAAAEAKKFLPGGMYAAHHQLLANIDDQEQSAYNLLRTVRAQGVVPPRASSSAFTPQLTTRSGGLLRQTCPEFIYVNEFLSGTYNANFSNNAWPVPVGALGVEQSRMAGTNNAYKPTPRMLSMYDPALDLRAQERQFFATYFIITRENHARGDTIMVHGETDTPSPYFYHDHGQIKGATTNSGRHFAIYRLAEMYLFAAEAIARDEGVTPEAVDALASVRARAYEHAGVTKAQIVSELTALSVQDFVEQVWLERYRELVFEFKCWNMIQRTRLYPVTNVMDATVPVGTARFVDITTVGTGFAGTRNFHLNNLLWPIPFSEMQRNPALRPNNPGYEVAIN